MRRWPAVVLVLVLGVLQVEAQCPPNLPVGSCAPKSGTSIAFTGDTDPVRVRKSVYALSAAEITELRRAFRLLRALPSTDPRRWLAEANVHCWNCAGDASTRPDVHGTWAFMPWHRVYLYNLEKVLGQLVGNPSLAIPYWDYNSPNTAAIGCGSHLKLPPPYVPQTVSGATNSLWDCYRGATAASNMSLASAGPASVNNVLNNFNTFSLFFGSPTQAAALWANGPHGYVHLWTGAPSSLVPRQDMGVLETAARDPLFWAHHANIDRIWDLWITRYGTPAYPQSFLNQSWTFWNHRNPSVLVRLTADDAANRATRLRYRYAAPACGTAPPTADPESVHAEHESSGEDMVRLTPQPLTVRTEGRAPERTFTIGGATGTRVVLHLDQVTMPADQSAVLRVYINNPDADATTEAAGQSFVQELYLVPARTPGTGGTHQHPFNLRVVLPPELAAAAEAANGQVPVTIVPVAATPEGVLEAVPVAVDIRMKRPYISVE